jgi:hypothetical protein
VAGVECAELSPAAFYVEATGRTKKAARRAVADEILRHVKNCVCLISLSDNCSPILISEKPSSLSTRRSDYISHLALHSRCRLLSRSPRSRPCRSSKANTAPKGKSVWKWRTNILTSSARWPRHVVSLGVVRCSYVWTSRPGSRPGKRFSKLASPTCSRRRFGFLQNHRISKKHQTFGFPTLSTVNISSPKSTNTSIMGTTSTTTATSFVLASRR